MVATDTQDRGRVVVQSVLSPALAERLKKQAELEDRSVSSVIRRTLVTALELGKRP